MYICVYIMSICLICKYSWMDRFVCVCVREYMRWRDAPMMLSPPLHSFQFGSTFVVTKNYIIVCMYQNIWVNIHQIEHTSFTWNSYFQPPLYMLNRNHNFYLGINYPTIVKLNFLHSSFFLSGHLKISQPDPHPKINILIFGSELNWEIFNICLNVDCDICFKFVIFYLHFFFYWIDTRTLQALTFEFDIKIFITNW